MGGSGLSRIQLFWALVALAIGLIIALLRDAMLPFAAAFFLAYALDPVVSRFEKFGLSRAMATTVVTGVLALVIGFFVAWEALYLFLNGKRAYEADNHPGQTVDGGDP